MTEPPVERPPAVELLHGVPPVTQSPDGLAQAIAALAGGEGPVAVDAERASGFRFSQRAYLVQFHRRGSGTWLLDPIALPDLSGVQEALRDAEWVLHAASQDLACLREVGLSPERIFDTELAGRLLGRERVGLGPLVEAELGLYLAKGHGAADWSTRPLPEAWLAYAALDVEVLLDLRDLLEADLHATGKASWAAEEFEAVRLAPPPAPRQDPWRRTSGIHRLKGRRALAIVQALWEARDDIARQRDISPGRILPDATIIAAATVAPRTAADLAAVPEFTRPGAKRYARRWWQAMEAAWAVAERDLPVSALPGDGPPPPRAWAERDPEAAARLAAVRAVMSACAEEVTMPVENLASPEALRRMAWRPPNPVDLDSVRAALEGYGARPWQVDLLAERLVPALSATAAS
ncbi:MAG: HRDC domain-containing protein [Candidatus Nanopelagicales bacterium]